MKARDILNRKSRELHTINVNAPVRDLVRDLTRKSIGAVVVLDETRELCGIVSERDILRLLDRTDGDIAASSVREIMTSEVVSAAGDDSVESLMDMMVEGKFRHLPIIDGREIIGLLSMRDIIQALASELEYENQVLKEYVMGVR